MSAERGYSGGPSNAVDPPLLEPQNGLPGWRPGHRGPLGEAGIAHLHADGVHLTGRRFRPTPAGLVDDGVGGIPDGDVHLRAVIAKALSVVADFWGGIAGESAEIGAVQI